MIYILSGPPCSGKSTYCKKYLKDIPRINKDTLRVMFGYKTHSQEQEKIVHRANTLLAFGLPGSIVIDNTHTKLNDFSNYLGQQDVTVILFKTSFKKQRIRNFFRYLRTRRWIPNKVSKRMNANFEELLTQLDYFPESWIIKTINT